MNHRIAHAFCAVVASAIFAISGSFGQAAAGTPNRPNIIVILADDMGFSDLGCYGSEIHTPNVDTLASQGVRFTQFYNMARCCPTRAALLTGIYPHQAGMGGMNDDRGTPSYQGELNQNATIPELLRDAGYHTGMVGKWHLCHLNIASMRGEKAKDMMSFKDTQTPVSPSKTNWPCNRGFEEHWGTIPGVEDYYDPYGFVHNEETIKPDKKDFYYTDFITQKTVDLINQFAAPQDGQAKPFFLYVAYTAPHWPMQAREEDVKEYADTYKVGWDAIREARYAKQKQTGIIDEKWGLSPRAFNKGLNDGPSQVGPWDDAPAKDWQARRMAVYAAMITCLDRGVGTITKTLAEKGLDQNTVVVFLSDNGACQENVQANWYDIPTHTRDGQQIQIGNKSDLMPGPEAIYQSYGPAWANASNTPFRRFKHFTEEGGISAPFIVRWPGVTNTPGAIDKTHVGDVIDFMPTFLAAAGVEHPKQFKGHDILPMEGKDLKPVLADATATFDRGALFWEHEQNRAVRIGDWKLVAGSGETWQLFNVAEDRTELHNLSAEHPEKVKELTDAYLGWAKRVGAHLRNGEE